jgi:hypothetical protein
MPMQAIVNSTVCGHWSAILYSILKEAQSKHFPVSVSVSVSVSVIVSISVSIR